MGNFTLVASFLVVTIALITALINYQNFKAIMSFSIYIEAKTVGPIPVGGRPVNTERIERTLSLNNITSQNLILTYFDVYLGNTGPGLVKNIKWEVDYCPDGGCNDIKWTKGKEEAFGPQAKKNIVGYLVRDINNKNNVKLKLPNKKGSFPWRISIEYDKSSIIHRKNRIKEIFEISQDGTVKRVSKIEIKRKIFRKHPL